MVPSQKTASIFGAPVTLLLAALIFCAVFAGGATAHLPEGLILAALGALMASAPPTTWPGRKWNLTVLALLAVASVGLLPADWFRPPPWRAGLENAGVIFPTTLSPQPRLTLESWLLLAAGCAWLSWLIALPCDASSRRCGARWFTGGAVLLAVFAVVQWKTGWRPPGWLSGEGRGPFPNRNHTAHVLALGGVLAVGCAADAAKGARARALPWLLAAGVILAGLAATFSRGGVMLFFAALAFWNGAVAWRRRSWKILLLGLAALCVAASALLVFGGGIGGRLAGGPSVTGDFRFRIWHDTARMIGAAPWHGAGLGNFSAVFSFFRDESLIQPRVIHPESDWLWLAAEIGLPGALLALGVLGIAFAGVPPLVRGTQRRLRGAALAASLAALGHTCLDVPGHRLGSVLAALFVFALARMKTPANPAAPGSRAAVACWRLLGLALVALGAWWIRFSDDTALAQTLASEGRFASAAQSAGRAIVRAPLDWRPYFTRAGALARSGKVIEAVADFRRARLLEPHFAAIPLEEGKFWARLQPELALAAWDDALQRAEGTEAAGVFGQVLDAAPDDPAFRARLWQLVGEREDLQMDWFLHVPAAEAKPILSMMSEIAGRTDEKRRASFRRRKAELETPRP